MAGAANPPLLLSILIPTLTVRQTQFSQLTQKLWRQVKQNGLDNQIEILDFLDDGEYPVGYKRNKLLERAQGKFVAFVDDDDDVSEDYIPLICRIIRENPNIDCVGLTGVITFAGKQPRTFIHSVQYRTYFFKRGIYYRPPYHLNPIKRRIASQYKFETINYSEDIDWAMRICRDRALQQEYFIDRPIYFYYSRRSWWYQWLLDTSEPIRHAFGLQLTNRVRLKRWLKSLL